MNLNIQFGHGMMQHSRLLVGAWRGGTVILSPRDLNAQQLESLAGEINALPGGQVLLDPQFYVPRSDHERLTAHQYWPNNYQTNAFFSGAGIQTLLDELLRLNETLGCSAFILPGLMAASVDQTWLDILQGISESALEMDSDIPLYATVALSYQSVRSAEGIQDILEAFEELDVDGAYLLFEHPEGQYIVQDPVWLTNALELAAGLRLLGKAVIVGYANHELLCFGAASVNAIASGTWMNVRAFSPDRFLSPDEDDIKRKSVWYYDPTGLSEYKLQALDMAHRNGALASMRPPPAFGTNYAHPLFVGVQPSSAGFGESEAFRHYLHCLMHQALAVRAPTFQATVSGLRRMLDSAERHVNQLENVGVRAGARRFGDGFDTVRAALAVLENTRGVMLRRTWSNL